MAVLKRDFLPFDLFPLLRESGYNGCVAVQARQTDDETDFLLNLMENNDAVKGVVGWLDLQADNIEDKLQKYSGNKGLKGLRHIVQSEPDPQFLLRPQFLRGIGLLQTFNLTYDILIFPQHLPTTIKFISKFPYQRFVLDHLAKPLIKDRKISPWDHDLRDLAAFPNVCCKLSGLVTEASWKTWSLNDFTPYLETALELFGADRLMIGSDWPVCLLAASYQEVMAVTEDYISKLSKDEQVKITGTNAIGFYDLC